MENNSAAGTWFSRLSDRLNDQVWFQQLKGKWDELDPQNKKYLQTALVIVVSLLIMFVVFGSFYKVHKLKKEVAEKNELLQLIQNANDEMRKLREATPGAAIGGRAGEQKNAPWGTYFESIAVASGLEKTTLTTSTEKPGNTGDLAKEYLYDISLKHVTIRQIVRFAFYLENGARPVKLRNITIDTKSDPTGYMDTTLSISAFTLKSSK